jgi:hypothetical protein
VCGPGGGEVAGDLGPLRTGEEGGEGRGRGSCQVGTARDRDARLGLADGKQWIGRWGELGRCRAEAADGKQGAADVGRARGIGRREKEKKGLLADFSSLSLLFKLTQPYLNSMRFEFQLNHSNKQKRCTSINAQTC